MPDVTRPNTEWTPDQLHVYRERLAIMGETSASDPWAACAVAYKQAEEWPAEPKETSECRTA